MISRGGVAAIHAPRPRIGGCGGASNRQGFFRDAAMSTDKRQKRDRHALDENGMVVCNPRDKEAAHRAEMEGIATDDRAAVTCKKCLALLYQHDKDRKDAP